MRRSAIMALLTPPRGPSNARRSALLAGITHAAALSQVPLLPEELAAQQALFPTGQLDQDLQQVDLRDRNSWRFLMHEVPTVELLEVQLEGRKKMPGDVFANGQHLSENEVLGALEN